VILSQYERIASQSLTVYRIDTFAGRKQQLGSQHHQQSPPQQPSSMAGRGSMAQTETDPERLWTFHFKQSSQQLIRTANSWPNPDHRDWPDTDTFFGDNLNCVLYFSV
jgi:hypothetical protein